MRILPGLLIAFLLALDCLTPAWGGPLLAATARQVLALARRPGAGATLVNVWATWCVPCRQEFPALLRAARAAPGLRLVLVSADFKEQLPEARRFLAAHGVRDTTYLKSGPDMEFINTLDPEWSGALPATFVYDRRGRQVDFWEGECDTVRLRSAIGQALGSHRTTRETTP